MIDLDLLVILDRSGSMQTRKADHEGGLRSFVDDQRSLAGDVRLTLVQFDTTNPCEIVYDRARLDTVTEITLVPRGGTPLLDAIGLAVAHLTNQQLIERAQQTIVMVVTDGQENASREWTRDRVKTLLTELEQAGGHVLYLGANVDAFSEASAVGVGAAYAANFVMAPDSVKNLYQVTGQKVNKAYTMMRGGASAQSVSSSMAFTDEERAAINTTTPSQTTGE